MKKILLSSFFAAVCVVAVAQVKPAAKQTASKARNKSVSSQQMQAKIAYKNKIEADLKSGKTPAQSVTIQKAP